MSTTANIGKAEDKYKHLVEDIQNSNYNIDELPSDKTGISGVSPFVHSKI